MPRWALTRRPLSSHVSTGRIYDDSGRISHRLHQRARRTTLRPVRMNRRAAPGVTPVGSSATPWTGGTIPHSLLRPIRTSPLWRCFLCGLPELNDPQEQAIHRNLRALVETSAVQQAESYVS